MNLVFLTTEATHHYFLINEIHRHHPVQKVFFQTGHRGRATWGGRLRRLTRLGNLRYEGRRILRKILFGREDGLRDRFEREFLFGGRTPALDSFIPVEEVISFNRPEGVEAVRKESPDLIVVFGTEILRGEILRIANLAIVNIHRDILPAYRGGGLPFWVFYQRDFETLGTTIHLCAERLDAGDIVGQKRYALRRDDRIYKLRARTTVLAAGILKVVIERYEAGTPEPRKQEKSKLWTAKELTILKELIARRNFRRYVKRLP